MITFGDTAHDVVFYKQSILEYVPERQTNIGRPPTNLCYLAKLVVMLQ